MQIAESRLHYDYALTMHSAIHTGCSLVGVRDRIASGKLISEVGPYLLLIYGRIHYLG